MKRFTTFFIIGSILAGFLSATNGICQEKFSQNDAHTIYSGLNKEVEQLHSKCFIILKQGMDEAIKKSNKRLPDTTEKAFLNTLPEFTKFWIKIRSYFYKNTPQTEASVFMQTVPRNRAALLEASAVAQYISLRFNILELGDVAIKCLDIYKNHIEIEKMTLLKFQEKQQTTMNNVFKLDPIVPEVNFKLPSRASGHIDLLRTFSALDERASEILSRYADAKNPDLMNVNGVHNAQIEREFRQVLNEYLDERLKLGVTLDELMEPQIALSARIAAGLSQTKSLCRYLSFRLKNPEWLSIVLDCNEADIVLANAMTNIYKTAQEKIRN